MGDLSGSDRGNTGSATVIPEPYLTLLSGTLIILAAACFTLIGRWAVNVRLLRHTVYAASFLAGGVGLLLIARGLEIVTLEQGRYWLIFICLWAFAMAAINLTVAARMKLST